MPTPPSSAVTSLPNPQPGQKHRSSGNFTTQGCSATFTWNCPDGVRFDVKEDVDGTDPTIQSGVKNGDTMENPNLRSVYIANPSGTDSAFLVAITND